MEKRLCKSNKNKVLTGVCGGVAEYFKIDPTIVRLVFVFTTTWIFYLILASWLPEDDGIY